MIVLSVSVFLIDLESVENLLNVMDLQKVNMTRENMMHPAKKRKHDVSPKQRDVSPKQCDVSPEQRKNTHKTR